MTRKHKLHIVRRIITRLARIRAPHLTARHVYASAAAFMSWPRERREAWIMAQYDDLVKYLGFTEEELAIAVV